MPGGSGRVIGDRPRDESQDGRGGTTGVPRPRPRPAPGANAGRAGNGGGRVRSGNGNGNGGARSGNRIASGNGAATGRPNGPGHGLTRLGPPARQGAPPGGGGPGGRGGPRSRGGPGNRGPGQEPGQGRERRPRPDELGAESGDGGGRKRPNRWAYRDVDGNPLLSKRGKPRRSRRQRVILGLAGAVTVMVLVAGVVAGYVLNRYNSIERVADIDIAQAPAGQPQNFLLVGSDTREGTSDEGSLSGRRSDTIMVVRLDPASDRVSVLSFPRDLMVEIPNTGERRMINSAYSMEDGEQVLIDTLSLNFGIPIHHYVEIDFNGFQQLVDTIGGVSLWIPNAVRDEHSGLFIEQRGCVTLQGEQALQFARSRYLDYMTPDGWERDPQSDVSRVQRQQIFIRRALATTLGQVRENPLRMNELVNIGVGNIRLDEQLGIGDIVDLAENFRDFSSERLETYSLPSYPSPDNENRLLVDDEAAEPVLNVFRGLDPSEVGAGVVEVQVANATGIDGLGNDVSGALVTVGFDVVEPISSDERPQHSIVYYAPGQENYGLRLARHVTGGTDLVEKADLTPGQAVLMVGADFQTIHQEPTPLDRMPASPGAPATTAPPQTTTTAPPPPTTTTTVSNGYIVGEPPADATC
ncbi:MAG TPA: LCP family protein [Acidimicrobiales bacterium]|nr:LCP family protein [Acidimicrobiales bacterium]